MLRARGGLDPHLDIRTEGRASVHAGPSFSLSPRHAIEKFPRHTTAERRLQLEQGAGGGPLSARVVEGCPPVEWIGGKCSRTSPCRVHRARRAVAEPL
jgi:hypothetical protein